MFYNTEMLTKRGPLARVWMASHLSTKLTKSTLLSTSISSSVESILGPALLPMALRLSGQLLLGVTRIYSRKTKYLLEDCNETLLKVKKAFGRTGGQALVEMDDNHQLGGVTAGDAVTLRAENGGLEDILMGLGGDGGFWDNDLLPLPTASTSNNKQQTLKSNTRNTAKLSEITLNDHSLNLFNTSNYQDDLDLGIGGSGQAFDFGPDGNFLGEGEYDLEGGEYELDLGFGGEEEVEEFDLDLGLDLKGKSTKRVRDAEADEERDDDDRSIEVGRDLVGSEAHASNRGSSIGPNLDFEGDIMMGEGGKELGEGGDMGGYDGDMDFGDFGGGGLDEERADRERTPQTIGDLQSESYAGLTPKTAADLAKSNTTKVGKERKARKQIVDTVIQTDRDAIDKSLAFTDAKYLPASRLHLLLSTSSSLPSPFLPQALPKSKASKLEFYSYAPVGLAPELSEMFKFPTRRSLALLNGTGMIRKQEEVEDEEDVEVEQGRRAERELSFGGMGDFMDDYGGGGREGEEEGGGGNGGYGFDPMGGEEGGFQFDLGEEEEVVTNKKNKKQKVDHVKNGDEEDGKSSRYNTHGASLDYEEGVTQSKGPLAIFDFTSTSTNNYAQSSTQQTQTQRGGGESLGETEEEQVLNPEGGAKGWKEGKWSKNTCKALEVLRTELEVVEEEEVVKEMKFEVVAEQATRRAAASFFFELLVLGTRDCIKVDQSEAYGSIKVVAKEKLWDVGNVGEGIAA